MVNNFQDSSLIAIAKECKNLEYLNISHCKYITEEGLNAITTIKSLRRLNVSHLECVRDSFLRKLKGLSLLKCNECQKISDVGLIQFINNCPDLKHLSADGTYMTIKTIIAADQATKHRENNIILHIHLCYKKLRTACRSIIESKWSWNNRERRPSLVFDNLSKLQNLEQLSLQSMITNESFDSSIIAIVDSCKSLTKLDISSCYDVTETTLIALTNSESLKELKIGYIHSVTDNFISKLKGLQCFDCTGCKKITDAGVIQLIKNCPDLENLDLDYTHVTTNTIIGASEATKNRRNNIILILDVDRILKRSFKSLNKSIWLALRR
ncbi:F-box/LRR-repeat protein 2-like [Aphidius gifuensis]|uniref:F-box/LRR-repeat protein 2-like n=1 Tax=Aphidius gifuensis TaxID=684658 RepID=UPI001CDCF4FA|nr:F-box/LRR-repeat protein 2-like [Aphidius gifuensis]